MNATEKIDLFKSAAINAAGKLILFSLLAASATKCGNKHDQGQEQKNTIETVSAKPALTLN